MANVAIDSFFFLFRIIVNLGPSCLNLLVHIVSIIQVWLMIDIQFIGLVVFNLKLWLVAE